MEDKTKWFVSRARLIHGDIYDYSSSVYKKALQKVIIICRDHGPFTQRPSKHLLGQGCPKCSSTKAKNTFMKKYGVENPFSSKEVRDKINQTNIERYGTRFPSQSEFIKKKQENTNIRKYGVKGVFQLESCRKKSEKTCLEKYGTIHPMKDKVVHNKMRETNLEKYGVEYPLQSESIKEKQVNSNILKYGTDHPAKRKYSISTVEIIESSDKLKERYKTQTLEEIAIELGIHRKTLTRYMKHFDIPILYIAHYSKISIQWLNTIMDRDNIYIQHAGNSGEYNIPNTRLLVDGYCKDSRTVYEFYGDCFHGNLDVYKEEDYPHPFDPSITTKDLYNRTIEREERIRELGYNIVSIWEKEWNHGK